VGDKKNPLSDVLERIPNPPRLAPLLNKQIDELFHKAADKNRGLYLVDSLAHLVVETADSIALSISKSVRYNLKKLVEGGKVEEK